MPEGPHNLFTNRNQAFSLLSNIFCEHCHCQIYWKSSFLSVQERYLREDRRRLASFEVLDGTDSKDIVSMNEITKFCNKRLKLPLN